MSDLVGNYENRFSHDTASFCLHTGIHCQDLLMKENFGQSKVVDSK